MAPSVDQAGLSTIDTAMSDLPEALPVHPADFRGLSAGDASQTYAELYSLHDRTRQNLALMRFVGTSGQVLTDATLERLALLDAENQQLASEVRQGRSAVDQLQAAMAAVEDERQAKQRVEASLGNVERQLLERTEQLQSVQAKLETLSAAQSAKDERQNGHRSEDRSGRQSIISHSDSKSRHESERTERSRSDGRERERSHRASERKEGSTRSHDRKRKSADEEEGEGQSGSSRRRRDGSDRTNGNDLNDGRRSSHRESRSASVDQPSRSKRRSASPQRDRERDKAQSASRKSEAPKEPKADRSSRLGRLGLPVNPDAAKRGFGILGRAAAVPVNDGTGPSA